MTKTIFQMRNMATIVACLAATMTFTTSCGGNASKKLSADGSTEAAKTETTAPQAVSQNVNIADHYKAVAKPAIAYVADWMIPADGILVFVNEQIKGTQTVLTVGGLTWAQYENYMKTLEANGMTKDENSSVGDVNNFFNDTVKITLDHDNGKKLGEDLTKSRLGIYIEKK